MPRKRKTAPGSATVSKPTTAHEVDRIIATSVRATDGVQLYRLRWKGFGAADDSWRTREELGNCAELVSEFEAERTRSIEALIGDAAGSGIIGSGQRRGSSGNGRKGHRRGVKSVSFCETVVRKLINAAGEERVEQTFLLE
ncbi:hypothetical protein EDC01DRAFT_446649 [Geopyxis carbonaria]|nr:hypothetical protein EDC01DRAFT_446649 [Geopyxis carbonaria]